MAEAEIFNKIRTTLHITTSRTQAKRDYEAEIERVKRSKFLDDATKKEVVKALKTAIKNVERDAKRVNYTERKFYPPAFVISHFKTATPSVGKIEEVYEKRMSVSGFGYIFSKTHKADSEDVYLTDAYYRARDYRGADRIARYFKECELSAGAEPVLQDVTDAARLIATQGKINFGEDEYIGISCDTKLEFALKGLANLREHGGAVLVALKGYEQQFKEMYRTGQDTKDITLKLTEKDREYKAGNTAMIGCERLFELAMKDKIKQFLNSKGITGINLEGEEVSLAFKTLMGIPLDEDKILSSSDKEIIKLVEKFAKDKTVKSAREKFIRTLIEAKHDYAVYERDSEITSLNLGVREVSTPFGKIDVVKVLGEDEVVKIEREYGIKTGQEEEATNQKSTAQLVSEDRAKRLAKVANERAAKRASERVTAENAAYDRQHIEDTVSYAFGGSGIFSVADVVEEVGEGEFVPVETDGVVFGDDSPILENDKEESERVG